MGNTLSASNPTEILPVEAYLSDLSCGDAVESLGSTRFMKVAKGKNTDGIYVWKVFLVQDDSLVLSSYRKEILRIRDALANAPNCSTVKKIYMKPKYAVLLRPYQKHTLCDRLSTRAFVVQQERIWYIYQLFKALAQCQKANVCHGDLKSQNIVISSSNWLQITDFAPFKPTYLPHDNPSSFTFFFDTSRRQSCYLAPERFLSTTDYERNVKEKGDSWLFGSLHPAMDMFSAGCVVFELLHDGKSPFSYGELCDYRGMKTSEAGAFLERLLSDVPSKFRPLLKMLLNREPSMRMTAQQVLDGSVIHFPKVLDAFFSYLNAFRPKDISTSQSIEDFDQSHSLFYLEPDDVISKLKRDEKTVWEKLDESPETRPFAVLFISLITANIRTLRSVPSKIDAMNLLVRLASLCDATIATERVLPYLVFALSENDAQVRAAAIYAITELMSHIEPASFEDSLIFIDYLLPEISTMLDKRSNCPTLVLLALATNLGEIAETAYRFHAIGRNLRSGIIDDECSGAENVSDVQQTEDEEQALNKALSEIFVILCSSPENCVRHCLVNPKSLAKLYNFFNKMGASEILLRHMITFLNIKSDWRLRAVFFDSLPICVRKRSVDVKPLLQQGLHDFEELVVLHAIHCICLLVEADVLERSAVIDLLEDTIPFLAHPNDWIRISVINLVVVIDSRWSLAEVHCRLLPLVRPYLKEDGLFRLNNKTVLVSSLNEPIPREIWKKIVTDMSVDNTSVLLSILECSIQQGVPFFSSEPWFVKIFGKDLIDAQLIWKLNRFNKLLPKMAEFRKTAGMETELTMQKGIVDLSSQMHSKVRRNAHQYTDNCDISRINIPMNISRMNNEWNEMFGSEANQTAKWTEDKTPLNTQMRSMRSSVCGAQLAELLQHKNELYIKKVYRGRQRKDESRSQSTSKVIGTLITHLHEHTDKITQMSLFHDRSLFASASLDGYVKLWSTRAITGECYGAVRSEASFCFNKNFPITSLGWAGNDVLAMSAGDGHILWANVAAMDPQIISKVKLPSLEGVPEQIHVCNHLVYVRSHHGVLYCLDVRVGKSSGPLGMHEVWRREVAKNYGLVTSFCVDPWGENWLTMGCTNRQLMLWDLRFQQEAMSWSTHHKLLPLKLWANPLLTSSTDSPPEIFVGYHMRGEVDVYELGTVEPSRTLWPSWSPPFTYSQSSPTDDDLSNLTNALCVCEDTGYVYTGDSHGSLRRWNLERAPLCEYISGSRRTDGRSPYRIAYNEAEPTRDLPITIYELRVPNKESAIRVPAAVDGKSSTCHRAPISDLLCIQEDLLASASADGVIKIWK